MPASDLPPDARRTFGMELRRAPAIGVLETAYTTFGVLLLIKVFDAGSGSKALLLGSARAGLIISVFIVPLLMRSRIRMPSFVGLLHALGGLGFLAAALFHDSLEAFVGGISAGLFCFALQTPLLTQLYRTNLPSAVRGRLFSLIGLVRALASIAFAYLGGRLLGHELEWYRVILFAFAASAFYSAVLFARLPYPENEGSAISVFGAFHWLREDGEFRFLIVSWMLMGVGNLMAMSLFVEVLANTEFGLGLAAGTVAVLMGVVPPVFKLAATYPCGALFDRLNFYRLRVLLNLVYITMILVFYLSGNVLGACLGLALQGLALAGGNVLWSLWVTKVAPADRVAEYMSVHTFMTGVRGTIAPFVAYALITRVGPVPFAWVCASLVMMATVILIPRALRPPA